MTSTSTITMISTSTTPMINIFRSCSLLELAQCLLLLAALFVEMATSGFSTEDLHAAMAASLDSLPPHLLSEIAVDPSSATTSFYDHCSTGGFPGELTAHQGTGAETPPPRGEQATDSDDDSPLPAGVKQAVDFANEPPDGDHLMSEEDMGQLEATPSSARAFADQHHGLPREARRVAFRSLRLSNPALHKLCSEHMSLQGQGFSWDETWDCYCKGAHSRLPGRGIWAQNSVLQEWTWHWAEQEVVDLEQDGEEPVSSAQGKAEPKKPEIPAMKLPRGSGDLEGMLRPQHAEKSVRRGTSAAAESSYQPMSRQRGKRKQELQYAEAVRKRKLESAVRQGSKRRQGRLHAD